MTKQKKERKLEKHLRKAVIGAVAGTMGLIYHSIVPTFFPRLYYAITDSSETTAAEQRIEQKFKIDYEGTSNEQTQISLEYSLRLVYITNPFLLSQCKKIVLHSEAVDNSFFIRPFLDYSAMAIPRSGTIELNNITEVSTIAHELAHLAHYYAPKEFDKELDEIFGDSYKRGLTRKNDVIVWEEDGSTRPNNGFVEPYGATNAHENVATYVAAVYIPYLWDDVRFQHSDKYLRMLSLLLKYGFISLKQFEEINTGMEYSRFVNRIHRSLNL
jgi:hypothetical protein